MYRKETLPNGVRIVTEEIPSVRSVSMGIWVGAGSRDENDGNNGVAHFIEHMMFKGTTGRSAKQIAEVLDAVGGQLNAFTSKEYTCYYAKVLDEHLDIAVDLLSDMFYNSTFKEDDINKERNVIIEEIKMYEDTPDDLVHDVFASTLWSGHALGRPIIGTEQTINDLSRSQILDFRENFYLPASTVVSVAGNIKHEEVVAKLIPIFSADSRPARPRAYQPPGTGKRLEVKVKDTEQVHLCVGTPGLSIADDKVYVMHVLNSILGGGISSRLFQEIREDRGLAYSIYTYHSSYRDAGLFSVYAGLSSGNLAQVIELISGEMRNMRRHGISAEELARTKEQLKGSMYLGQENVSNRMSRMGKSELCLNKLVTVDESVEMINRVSLDDVRELAQQFFQGRNIVVSSVGPEIDEQVLQVEID